MRYYDTTYEGVSLDRITRSAYCKFNCFTVVVDGGHLNKTAFVKCYNQSAITFQKLSLVSV